MAYLVAALLWLAPHLGGPVAERLAAVVAREARQHNLSAHLLLAYVQVESHWHPRRKSPTQDHGLGQIHVSATTNPELLGQQEALLRPEYNLAVTASMMRMWRDHHEKVCVPTQFFWFLVSGEAPHHYINHLKWGYRVRDQHHARRVLGLAAELQRLFPATATQAVELDAPGRAFPDRPQVDKAHAAVGPKL